MTRITLRPGILHEQAGKWLSENLKSEWEWYHGWKWDDKNNQYIIKDDAIAIMFRLRFGK